MSRRPATYKASLRFLLLYKYLSKQALTKKQLQRKLKISESTLYRYIIAIQTLGLIKEIKTPKTTYYSISN